MKIRTVLAAVALLAAAGGEAAAQTSTREFENYCRVGSIRTCATVRVVTTWDPVAQVTRVELWLRNLQGSHPADNTGGGAITRFGLIAPAIRNPAGLTVTGEDGAGTVGAPAGSWTISNRMVEGPVTFSTTTTTAEGGVQGCNVHPGSVQNYFQTCGGGWVVFRFTTTNQWNAADAQIAWKVYSAAADGGTYYACRTDNNPTWGEFCEAVDPTVTPEPASMALLGTGLLGLAGFARRRRRRDAQDEERSS